MQLVEIMWLLLLWPEKACGARGVEEDNSQGDKVGDKSARLVSPTDVNGVVVVLCSFESSIPIPLF